MTKALEDTGLTTNTKIWIGIGIGAAIGVALALSRRKPDRWETAKDIRERISSHSGDLADAGKNILERVGIIYDESRKVAEEAAELWKHGRRLVGY